MTDGAVPLRLVGRVRSPGFGRLQSAMCGHEVMMSSHRKQSLAFSSTTIFCLSACRLLVTLIMATNGRIKADVRIVPVEAGDMDGASPWIYKAFQGDHVNDMMYPARKRDPKMTDEQRHKYVARSYEKRRESAQQGKCEYLKAVDVESGAILGVAEWVKPGTPIRDAKTEMEKAEKEQENPEMDYDYMNRFMGTLCDTREKYMGEKPHW